MNGELDLDLFCCFQGLELLDLNRQLLFSGGTALKFSYFFATFREYSPLYLKNGMWSVSIDARRELDPLITERLVTTGFIHTKRFLCSCEFIKRQSHCCD